VSGTSTHKIPARKLNARVRAATADPQAKGQASSAPSGARRKLPATTFSRVAARDSMEKFDFSIPGGRVGAFKNNEGARRERRSNTAIFRIAI